MFTELHQIDKSLPTLVFVSTSTTICFRSLKVIFVEKLYFQEYAMTLKGMMDELRLERHANHLPSNLAQIWTLLPHSF